MPARYRNFIFEQGSTFERTLNITNSDGAPTDLAGYQARMQVRSEIGRPVVILLTTENGRIQITSASGAVHLLVSASDLDAMDLSSFIRRGVLHEPAPPPYQADPYMAKGLLGVYDLELISPGGDVYRVLQGEICISLQVTA